MSGRELRKCPQCRQAVPVGETRCPNGHECVWTFSDSSVLDLDGDSDTDLFLATPSGVSEQQSPIFECTKCSRLMDAQSYQGRVILPRFCAWCGKPLSSIVGRELDGYRIDSVLSAGGFGIVYLASNISQPSMKAVVKILRPQIAYSRPDFIKVFLEEARLTEAIGQTCWNIVRVSNVREKPWPYFFMEYVRGPTLEHFIEANRDEKVPLSDCVGFLRGVARALDATHGRGRVHRDLKPLNIMVMSSKGIAQPADRIKMLDFGLAMKTGRLGQNLGFTDISRDSMVLSDGSPVAAAGTPEYMAPEAFEGLNDVEADIYSFGITAYEIVAGDKPWKDPPSGSERLGYWVNCHKYKRPTPLRELRPDVPKWLARVIADCLEKDPAKRLPSAAELLLRLRAPVALWVKLAAVAAIAFVVSLVVVVLKGSEDRRPLPSREDKDLFVQHEKDLAGRINTVKLPDHDATAFDWQWRLGGDSDWKSGAPPVSFQVSKDTLTVGCQASGAAELLDELIEIQGTRTALFTRTETILHGSFRVVHDQDPPRVVGGCQFVTGSDPPQAVNKEHRFRRSEVDLVVEIDEPNVYREKVFLYASAMGGTPIDIAGYRKSSSSDELWYFSLKNLDNGTYEEAYVTVEDRAANKNDRSEAKPFQFTVDDVLDVRFAPDDAFLIDSRLFVPFTLEENVQSIEVATDSGEPFEKSMVEYPEASDLRQDLELLEIADRFDTKKQKRVVFEHLEVGGRYLLSVPVTRTEGEFFVTVTGRDHALPKPNEQSRRIPRVLPLPLSPKDIIDMTIEIEGTSRPVDRDDAEGSPLIVRCSGGNPNKKLSGALTIDLNLESVVRATCNGAKGELDEAGRLVFALQLVPNQANELVLEFEDPLNRAMARTILVQPDTETAELKISLNSEGFLDHPEYHQVPSGKEISLTVQADEPLREVVIRLNNKSVSRKVEGKRVELTLKEFSLREGSYPLMIEAEDLAGRRTPDETAVVVVNPAGPTVTYVDKEQGGRLELGKRAALFFTVEDNNEIDRRDGEFIVRLDEPWGRDLPVPIRSDELSGTFLSLSVNLDDLPGVCSGTLIAKIPDRLGLVRQQEQPFVFRRQADWEPLVRWNGLYWVLFTHENRSLYISRTEVTNKIFKDPAFVDDTGNYKDAQLRAKFPEGPQFWNGGEFPQFKRDDETVRGDNYPVVGISAVEAEAFARTVFRARLPTWEEWLSAGSMGNPNPNRKFPWVDEEAGWNWINYHFDDKRSESSIAGERTRNMKWQGGELRYKVVPSTYIERSLKKTILRRTARKKTSKKKNSRTRIAPGILERKRSLLVFHQLGNVEEWVRSPEPDVPYGAAGGSFSDAQRNVGLDVPPKHRVATHRDRMTGFRPLIDPEDADEEFERAARRRERERNP